MLTYRPSDVSSIFGAGAPSLLSRDEAPQQRSLLPYIIVGAAVIVAVAAIAYAAGARQDNTLDQYY
jgi:hypothetical protein